MRDALLAPRKESEIQSAILDYLKTVPGVVAWRNNVGAMRGEHKGRRWFVRYGFPGLSDIIGWIGEYSEPGLLGIVSTPSRDRFYPKARHVARFLAIECKRPGQKLTPHQEAFLSSVNDAGGLGVVATCVQDVVEAFARARRPTP